MKKVSQKATKLSSMRFIVRSVLNNTFVTITDTKGNVVKKGISSAGNLETGGVKGSRKKTNDTFLKVVNMGCTKAQKYLDLQDISLEANNVQSGTGSLFNLLSKQDLGHKITKVKAKFSTPYGGVRKRREKRK